MSTSARTLFDKVWDAHVIRPETPDTPAVLFIDLHLIHEVTSPQAFDVLRERGLKVRRPDRCVATMDHSTPTTPGLVFTDRIAEAQVRKLEENCKEFGIQLYGLDSDRRGIVHVIGPELGLTRPGRTIVCGDSHTSTHGAFGALAFGIGTTEVSHVLATQCLLQRKAKNFAIRVEGRLQPGVTAKDLILAIIAKIGVDGGTGHVLEYMGPAVRALSIEERMTVCNMSIEAGARAGMIAPDDRPDLQSDEGATFDREETLDASKLEPMITYGTNPGAAIPVRDAVPRADEYMALEAGKPLLGRPIDVVFIGSCTNSRISDLRAAAKLMEGRKVSVRTLVVPGSEQVKRQAEAEGLNTIFREAGAEWREPGCSMCIAMNGDQLKPGQYAVSTSNRNFKGRQGAGGRTILASPLTAAASAVSGKVSDPREILS